MFVVAELFNVAVNEYCAKKAAQYRRVLVVTELVVNGTEGCARFAAILLAGSHCQFLHKRSSFISHRPFIVESCNSCRMDQQFVHVQVENVKISAKRAHLGVCSFC